MHYELFNCKYLVSTVDPTRYDRSGFQRAFKQEQS